MMYSKNWSAIAALSSVYVKLCLIFTTDEAMLERLERGFPECFLPAGEASETLFPLSVVLQVANDAVQTGEASDRSTIDEVLAARLGLPSMECAPADAESFDPEKHLPMPDWVIERYDELRANWRESGNFPWRFIEVQIRGGDYYLGYVSEEGVSKSDNSGDEWKRIVLYPAELINTGVYLTSVVSGQD